MCRAPARWCSYSADSRSELWFSPDCLLSGCRLPFANSGLDACPR